MCGLLAISTLKSALRECPTTVVACWSWGLLRHLCDEEPAACACDDGRQAELQPERSELALAA